MTRLERQRQYRSTPEGRRYTNEKAAEYSRRLRAERPRRALWIGARRRAKSLCIPFSIEESDILIPSFCPVLGIPLYLGTGKTSDSSPTLDRLKPELGYVAGNVFVISHRANRLKNNGRPEELRAIADWMERCGYV